MNRRFNYFILLTFIMFSSCSGYHFKNKVNPFISYEIESISIPMFLNWSTVPNVSGPMTASITNMLMDYPDLKIYTYENTKADAILVGIISSDDQLRDVLRNTSYQPTLGNLEESIGERRAFYIPQVTNLKTKLRIILIKNPTPVDFKLAAKLEKLMLRGNPRVIFDEEITLETGISRVISPSSGPDSGGAVNFTKSKKAVDDAVLSLVSTAKDKFKQEILDAF